MARLLQRDTRFHFGSAGPSLPLPLRHQSAKRTQKAPRRIQASDARYATLTVREG